MSWIQQFSRTGLVGLVLVLVLLIFLNVLLFLLLLFPQTLSILDFLTLSSLILRSLRWAFHLKACHYHRVLNQHDRCRIRRFESLEIYPETGNASYVKPYCNF